MVPVPAARLSLCTFSCQAEDRIGREETDSQRLDVGVLCGLRQAPRSSRLCDCRRDCLNRNNTLTRYSRDASTLSSPQYSHAHGAVAGVEYDTCEKSQEARGFPCPAIHASSMRGRKVHVCILLPVVEHLFTLLATCERRSSAQLETARSMAAVTCQEK